MQNRPRWEREDRDSRIDRNRQSKRLVFRRSLFLMLVCGVGLFIPLVIQLWTISIRDHDFYQQRATDQQLMDVSVSAHRGDILDANGDVLAMSATVYNLILAPKDLMNSVDQSDYTDEEGNETRVYPYNRVFAHVVGYDSNGKSGIESLENFALMTSHNDYIDQVKNEIMEYKNPGDTVVTTLNAKLQQTAYNALGDYNGAVVVMDPQTGAVLASVSKPDFDPNTIEADWDTLAVRAALLWTVIPFPVSAGKSTGQKILPRLLQSPATLPLRRSVWIWELPGWRRLPMNCCLMPSFLFLWITERAASAWAIIRGIP